jgi:hypothetical protein
VLLLGSYPSEVSANLSLEKLDPGQPTTVQGHEFYSGRLESRRVVRQDGDENAEPLAPAEHSVQATNGWWR